MQPNEEEFMEFFVKAFIGKLEYYFKPEFKSTFKDFCKLFKSHLEAP